MIRILIASILAGLVIFLWSFVSHTMLPIGEMGVHTEKLATESEFLDGVRTHIPESGLYFVPGKDALITDVEEQFTELGQRMESAPVIFMAVRKDGAPAMSMQTLGSELGSNIFAAFIAAIILTAVPGNFIMRMFVVVAIALFAWVNIDLSHVFWYGFPTEYAFGQLIDIVVGWSLASVVLVALVKPCSCCSTASAESD